MNQLSQYYVNENGEENRFAIDQAHAVEYTTSMHFLHKHLPQGCRVLDCCAGAGAYAFPLAEQGFRVTASDLMPNHAAIMREKNANGALENIYQGDVLDMSRFDDETFDALLCFGALYHLFDPEKRRAAVIECLRVLKSGGVLALAYINRNAIFINHLSRGGDFAHMERVMATGENDVFYGMDFGAMDALIADLPLAKLADVGANGLMYPLMSRINALSCDEFAAYMNYHLKTCEQPSIIGHSMHGLWLGKKC